MIRDLRKNFDLTFSMILLGDQKVMAIVVIALVGTARGWQKGPNKKIPPKIFEISILIQKIWMPTPANSFFISGKLLLHQYRETW